MQTNLHRTILSLVMVLALVGVPVSSTLADNAPANATTQAQAIVNAAASQSGTPYCMDGGNTAGPTHGSGGSGCESTSIKGFDCSGLALYAVYQATNIVLPHGHGMESAPGSTLISKESDLQPGDLVFFGGGSLSNFDHVGIYAGNGIMWDANDYNVPVQQHTLAWEEHALPFDGGVRYWSSDGSTPGGGTDFQPFAGDFNGDGIGDIGLRKVSNGNFFIKHGPDFSDQVVYTWASGSDYQPFVGDFNGDGITDIGLRNVSNGNFFIKHGPSFSDQVVYSWSVATGTDFQPIAGDFNGDGIGDIGLRRISNGNFYIKHGPSFGDQVVYTWAPGTNYQPFVADFNGDGQADIGLRNVSNGNFFIKHGPDFSDQLVYAWSVASGTDFQPFAGDFNGDGIGDIGLRRISNGNFFIKHGTSFSDQVVYPWSTATG